MREKINPDWISAAAMREWLDIKTSAEYEWRKRYNLHIAKMGDKTYYDRNQIMQIMTKNSTYAYLHESKEK